MLNKVCMICKKIFKVYEHRKNSAKYCSLKCRNESYKDMHFSKKTEFYKGQIFSKIRNKKISKALLGVIRVNRIKKECLTCHNVFEIIPSLDKKRKYCSLKCFYKDPNQIKRMIKKGKEQIFTKERNLKISKSMKGKLPKNWIKIIKRRNKYWQKKMFKIIKQYFKFAQYEYRIDINKKHRRFLDVAIVDRKIDFEYDGMIHLSNLVKKNDIIRDRQLSKLGWKIIRINKDNYNQLNIILKQLINGDINEN